MAMTLPVAMPSTPSSGDSPASDAPRTPISPNMPILQLPEHANSGNNTGPTNSNSGTAPNGQMKRKPSRRANTAERRATHNAVERQRRETLNGRFLDLAALLPNLSQIRRPSKSSIVNSSIAHIHASRRHRLLASRELRLVKLESDALRRELNEWRDRAGLPRVEEPVRAEGFSMVLSGELEVIAAVPGEDDDDEDNQAYGGYVGGEEDDFGGAMDGVDEMRNQIPSGVPIPSANPFAHNLPAPNGNVHLSHVPSRAPHGPMIATNPSTVSYENPAMAALYEPHPHQNPHYASSQFIQHQHPSQVDAEKWNAHLYMNGPQQIQMLQAQRSLYTPPSSAHGLPTAPPSASGNPPPNPFSDPASQAFFANFQRQHFNTMHQQQIGPQGGHMYGSPEHDDSSSVGSGRGGRGRSSSLSNGSAYGSPSHVSNSGSYEMPSTLSSLGAGPGDYGVMRAGVGSAHWGPGDGELGMLKQNLNAPINGSGFGLMV
jgi:hypothetical protein